MDVGEVHMHYKLGWGVGVGGGLWVGISGEGKGIERKKDIQQ
jgi:hypothetical protein